MASRGRPLTDKQLLRLKEAYVNTRGNLQETARQLEMSHVTCRKHLRESGLYRASGQENVIFLQNLELMLLLENNIRLLTQKVREVMESFDVTTQEGKEKFLSLAAPIMASGGKLYDSLGKYSIVDEFKKRAQKGGVNAEESRDIDGEAKRVARKATASLQRTTRNILAGYSETKLASPADDIPSSTSQTTGVPPKPLTH